MNGIVMSAVVFSNDIEFSVVLSVNVFSNGLSIYPNVSVGRISIATALRSTFHVPSFP